MANSAEAQAWVSIGTNLSAKTKGVEKEKVEEVKKQEKDDDTGSEKQLHLDEDALQLEPFASDDFVAGDKFEQEVAQQNGHDTKEEPSLVVSDKQDKEKERDRKPNSEKLKDEDDLGHQTNSNNPELVRSRIFVGHLNTEKCSRKDVEDLFSPFGKVLACSLQQGYGFVQYDSEQSARKAIRELHGVNFFGMKLVVDKTAAQKKSDGEDPRARKPWPGEKEYPSEGINSRRHNLDRQASRDYDYRQERYAAASSSSLHDPYSSHYREPYDKGYDHHYDKGYDHRYDNSYDKGYDRRYERLYEPHTYDRGGYEQPSTYERYAPEKTLLDRYSLYAASSSKPPIHDRDYYGSRDPYQLLSSRRWEERGPTYNQYGDYNTPRARAEYIQREEQPYYSVRDDPYNPRHDLYERRPYGRYTYYDQQY